MKKNIRRIPASVTAKLQTIADNSIVVGCAKKFSAQAIQSGLLTPLGISLTPTGLIVPPEIVPPSSQGKYSDRNVNGEVVVRKDLPKETKYRSMEVPSWGSYRTHTITVRYEAYPREFHPPRELAIKMVCANPAPHLTEYVVSFQVDEVLDKTARDFEERLLEDLNLLQESIGTCGVQASGVSLANYAQTLNVSWDVLPPGTKDAALQRLFRGRTPSQQQRDVASDRFDFFQSLRPAQLVYGSSGMSRYFGALIKDDLVVFENIEYGNAVYVMFSNWRTLSQRSRVELLSGAYGEDFERITHGNGWKGEVRKVIADRQNGNG